jgi:4-diphosphocytidyl-2-C-methyl-D-erythritol kinase
MISFPNAKINLGLNILNKRNDEFHEIESVFYPVKGLRDGLEIIESSTFAFTSSGLNIPGNSSSNLCVKAYELLKNKYCLPAVNIHLHKVIPMGAGLGGGSADGAFVISMLDEIFHLEMSVSQKEKYGLELGSDCPFFIENIPALAKGRGEVLSEIGLDLSNYHIAVINPNIHVSTKEAYSGVVPQWKNELLVDSVSNNLKTWKSSVINQFEISLFPKYAQIEAVKNQLYKKGALYASMTGSGSTVYGLFESTPEVNEFNPDYFIWTGKL